MKWLDNMDSTRYENDLDQLRSQNKRLMLVALLQTVVLFLAFILTLNLLGRDRTIVTPPTIDKSFWVTSDTASDDYIRQMSLWVSSLILDVTPDDVAYKEKLLLQYAHPELHGKLKERQDIEAERLRRDNTSTYFVMQTIRTHPEKLAAVISGRLHTLINGNHVADQEKNFLVRFKIDGGRAQLVEFTETQNADLAKLLNVEDGKK